MQLVRWNTELDSFEPGHWFHGRIYEKRCDLSPDGELLIYFAQQLNRRNLQNKEYTYAWTAVSRPPYLTALALWPKGDCWHGGGLFETNGRVWLNHRPEVAVPHRDHQPRGLRVIPNPHACGEDAPIFERRLQRDGWESRQECQVRLVNSHLRAQLEAVALSGRATAEAMARLLRRGQARLTLNSGYVTDRPSVREKRNPKQPISLVMTAALIGFAEFYDFGLNEAGTRRIVPLQDVEWADWDHRGRLVYASEGKLFAAGVSDLNPLCPRELIDLNAATPEPKEAPAWAQSW